MSNKFFSPLKIMQFMSYVENLDRPDQTI